MSRLIKSIIYIAAATAFGVLMLIVGYILIKGVPHIKPSLFEWEYTTENVSMLPAIINTLIIMLLSLSVAVPTGVFAAVYLSEYVSRKRKIIKVIRLASETLAGIPSIIYGLFGLLFFVSYLNAGYSMISGSATVAIMILPIIMRTAGEALHSVPDSLREAALGLGSGRLRMITKIILPSAMPGILSGVILAAGRIVSETAVLIYTAGTVAKIPENLFSSGRTLSVHMYALSGEGFYMDEAFATAVVLLIFTVTINAIARKAARINRKVD